LNPAAVPRVIRTFARALTLALSAAALSACGDELAGPDDGNGNGGGGPGCGNGIIEEGEQCDGLNLGTNADGIPMDCVRYDQSRPLGNLACNDRCRWDASDCAAWVDTDGDRVRDQRDLEPENAFVCQDSDGDGCDDCAIAGFRSPENDGFDPDGDGFCDANTELDPDCMNGRNAPNDPYREQACIMFELMNQDRAHFQETESGGASKLEWNEDIWEVAVAHSRDMCERGFFAHNNPEGQSPSDRARAAGLNYGLGENIAINFNPYQAQFAFMNEPTCRGHRMNVLNSSYAEAAVGYHVCGDNRHFSTQNFRGGGGGLSSYCANRSNHCRVPPDPPSVAARHEACNDRFCTRYDPSTPRGEEIVREYCPELF
jgi:hypothetical protein